MSLHRWIVSFALLLIFVVVVLILYDVILHRKLPDHLNAQMMPTNTPDLIINPTTVPTISPNATIVQQTVESTTIATPTPTTIEDTPQPTIPILSTVSSTNEP